MVKILEKEILRYDPSIRQLSKNNLVLITKMVNMRPNALGLSPRELAFGRSWTDNSRVKIYDEGIAKKLSESRLKQNSAHQKHLTSKGFNPSSDQHFK